MLGKPFFQLENILEYQHFIKKIKKRKQSHRIIGTEFPTGASDIFQIIRT